MPFIVKLALISSMWNWLEVLKNHCSELKDSNKVLFAQKGRLFASERRTKQRREWEREREKNPNLILWIQFKQIWKFKLNKQEIKNQRESFYSEIWTTHSINIQIIIIIIFTIIILMIFFYRIIKRIAS